MAYERTEEHRKKMSDLAKRRWTPERREAMRQMRVGENNPFFGKKHSKARSERLSAAMAGEANPFFGKSHSPETIETLRQQKLRKTRLLLKYGISPEQYKAKIEAGFMWCSYHKDFAPIAEFVTRWGTTSRAGRCIKCVWIAMLRNEYGVTPEWYEAKLAEQGGGCALCGKQFDMHGDKKRNLAVDHDHKTGANRGILCHKCNSSIERIESILGWADKAVAYLKHYAAAA